MSSAGIIAASRLRGIDNYQAVLNYAVANGIAVPDATQQTIDRQLMDDLIANGSYEKMDVIGKFTGTATPAFKLICWKRKISMNQLGGITWTTNGAEGNGSTGFIKTGFIASTNGIKWQLNNAGVFWVGTKNPTGVDVRFGGQAGVFQCIPNRGANNSIYSINGGNVTTLDYGRLGANGLYRTSSTQIKYISDATYTLTSNSTISDTIETFIFARNNAAGAGQLFSVENIKFIAFGANMEAEHPSLKSLLE